MMTIAGLEFDGDILGIWFIQSAHHDMLSCTGVSNGHVRMAIRFRRYVDAKVWDSADEKTFEHYDGGPDTPGRRAEAVKTLSLIAEGARNVWGYEVFHFAGGTLEEAYAWVIAQPFANVKAGGESGPES